MSERARTWADLAAQVLRSRFRVTREHIEKMKAFLVLTLTTWLAVSRTQAQTYGAARSSSTSSITVPTGHVCEILSFTKVGSGSSYLSVDGSQILYAKPVSEGTHGLINIFVPGPKSISMEPGTSTVAYCTYRFLPNGASLPITNQPSNSVVIPTNATGPVQIILESSVDLVSWTAANPGTYSSTTSNRFFRVRAVQQ